MIETIKGSYDGMKAAFQIAQGINALKSETEKNQAVIDIQRHLLDAQRALTEADNIHSSDLRRIDDLEQQIVSLKDWAAEKERYELIDAGQGTLAYRVKAGMENGEPPHLICPQCYADHKKTHLQPETEEIGRVGHLICHRCSLDIVTSGPRRSTSRPGPAASGRR